VVSWLGLHQQPLQRVTEAVPELCAVLMSAYLCGSYSITPVACFVRSSVR